MSYQLPSTVPAGSRWTASPGRRKRGDPVRDIEFGKTNLGRYAQSPMFDCDPENSTRELKSRELVITCTGGEWKAAIKDIR